MRREFVVTMAAVVGDDCNMWIGYEGLWIANEGLTMAAILDDGQSAPIFDLAASLAFFHV
jgi:hypothetical protein